VAGSEAFFAYSRPADFSLSGDRLTFTSPLRSPHPENSRVYADLFPAGRAQGRAVLVLPQWNADAGGHAGLCRLLSRCGITALRMSLAYHDRRRPAGQRRADFHVSANVGRTIHASRQSVVDARACLDWLEEQGYHRLGILGTSLGSCIAYVAAAHDNRIRAGVFNHVSLYFGDVVWTGLATEHVRRAFGAAVTQDELRQFWTMISPAAYLDRMTGKAMESLLIWARHDTTFLPEYSRRLVEESRLRGHRARAVCLPCAHYTTGQFPFNLMDAFLICRFLRQRL
jgi:pimeloyl-ACP methyl ester carboxylesterase